MQIEEQVHRLKSKKGRSVLLVFVQYRLNKICEERESVNCEWTSNKKY